ncbi:hypothetical protein [Pseudoruegeria sp. HB172150]|uniref:hypothetical protein n=1 Tax=Pseudoruegeria sp. HB172150 TaxID=2721164 RepID=UPI001553EE4D|nr:hypothetical protein [Pseudoruegeria sp. HB172150]
MFEVGKSYRITELERESNGLYRSNNDWKVTAVDGHLVTLEAFHHPEPRTLNTMSAFFHSAVPVTGDLTKEPVFEDGEEESEDEQVGRNETTGY